MEGRTVVSIATGFSHNLALCSDGTLAAWGEDSGWGGRGDGTSWEPGLTPVPVKVVGTSLEGRKVVAIAAGFGHSVAMCSDGTLSGWGRNGFGEVGDNTNINRLEPVAVSMSSLPSGTRFAGIFSGSDAANTLALATSTTATGGSLTVTNINDSGPGSLRQAILDANLLPDSNVINFAITPLNGTVKTIQPLSELPAITAPVTIDGYTQSGASPNTNPLFGGLNSVLRVEIDGSNTNTLDEFGSPTTNANGLEIAKGADGCVIRGLIINRFNVAQYDLTVLSKGSASRWNRTSM